MERVKSERMTANGVSWLEKSTVHPRDLVVGSRWSQKRVPTNGVSSYRGEEAARVPAGLSTTRERDETAVVATTVPSAVVPWRGRF